MRYIGNKAKLLEILENFLKERGIHKKWLVFCDLFSWTCTVWDYFKDVFDIIANDSLYFSYCICNGKLKYKENFFENLWFDPFEYFNNADTDSYTKGFCYNNFAPTVSWRMYFSDENAKMIDFIRDTIDERFEDKKITENEKYYLIASLIESVSKVANVAWVYSAFLRIWDPRAVKRMIFIPVETNKVAAFWNEAYLEDATELVKKISWDILYLDPPYTPTQYVSQYHVLETIARNDQPETHWVWAHRDNWTQISKRCKKGCVHEEFEKVIANAKFKHILFSYSDAWIMSKEFIEKVMKRYAKEWTFIFEKIDFVKYKSTRAVKREEKLNTKDVKHYEWLFYIEKKETPLYVSPLNYIGWKYDILPFLFDNFPKKIDTFYDLFWWGWTVAINVNANKVVYNDINFIVRDLLEKITHSEFIDIYDHIEKRIKKFWLEKWNKEAYVNFRSFYNSKEVSARDPLDLFLLICYWFEHQIRFNTNLEFNNPCGNSWYNQELMEKLISYSIRTKSMNIVYKALDYKKLEDEIVKGDFVYCDPPYLITCWAYNDGKRWFNWWDKKQEVELLEFLSRLDKRWIKFALSNIVEREWTKNEELIKWIDENKYNIVISEKKTLRNRQDRRECIIKNF